MENSTTVPSVPVEEKTVVVEEKAVVVEEKAVVVEMTETKKNNFDFLKLFSGLFGSDEQLNQLKIKLSIRINDNVIQLIKLILSKSPDSLKMISKTFEEVTSDGVLDANDVPKIVLLITNLYKSDFKKVLLETKLKLSDLAEFINFLIHTVIEMDIVKVDNKEKIFQVLNVSLMLLETTADVDLPSIQEVHATCLGWCKPKKTA